MNTVKFAVYNKPFIRVLCFVHLYTCQLHKVTETVHEMCQQSITHAAIFKYSGPMKSSFNSTDQ